MIKETIKYSPHTGLFIIERSQDISPMVTVNTAQYNHAEPKGQRYKNFLTKVASIPVVLVEEWRKEGLDIYNKDHQKDVNRRLNDRDYRKLRTLPGKL